MADYFGKRHEHVLDAIDTMIQEGIPNFRETPWTNPQNGQTYREYVMDRDGFELLVMGFTGAKARKFKQEYIAEFNRMETELNARQQAPAVNLHDARSLRALLLGYTEQVVALEHKVEEQQQELAVVTPKALAHDKYASVSDDWMLA